MSKFVFLPLLLLGALAFAAAAAAKPSSSHSHPACTAAQVSRRHFLPAYDFIVVGAGAAGSIVSSGLAAEFPEAQVLLLEAGVRTGNQDNENIVDPALWLNVLHNDTLEWLFTTVPQTQLNQRSIALGFAKGTGGSAMHNAMGYVRGGRGFMDQWESENGCTGWSSATLLPAFDQFESRMNMVAPANDTQGLVDAIFQASNQAGFPYNPSYNNGDDMFGIANFVMSIQDAMVEVEGDLTGSDSTDLPYRRVTSYQTYVESSSPANLQLATGMLAVRIGFNDAKVAQSLEVYDEEQGCAVTLNLAENGNLILSTGTINSPAILQRSGIGNTSLLSSLNIPVVSALPGVGMNLRDDIVVNLVFTTQAKPLESPPASFLSAVLFAEDDSSQRTDASSSATGHLTNIELLFSTGNMISNSWPAEWQNSLVLSPNVQQLESRGTVTITSPDPFVDPAIDTAYLTAPGDLDRVVNSLLLSRSILAQPAFEGWNFTEVQPGSQYTTRDQLKAWVHANAGTGFHYIGTCKLGSSSDPFAVVNPENMSVYGVTNLRLVDASVAPTSFSANTQALTMAVATRGVELIIKDVREQRRRKEEQPTQTIALE